LRATFCRRTISADDLLATATMIRAIVISPSVPPSVKFSEPDNDRALAPVA
jgi:hypothetical protein